MIVQTLLGRPQPARYDLSRAVDPHGSAILARHTWACRGQRYDRPPLAYLLFVIFFLGCGGAHDDSVPVHGKVTNAGEPLAVKGRELGLGYVELHFYRMNDDGSISRDPADAAVEESGDFTVRGRDGRGLPPGKYKITVRQLDPAPDQDKLGGRFNLDNSRIVREVTGEEILLDVSRLGG